MNKITTLILLLVLNVLICLPAQEGEAEFIGFNAEQAFYAYFGAAGKTPPNEYLTAFMETCYPQQYQNTYRNEFEFAKLKQVASKRLSDGITGFNRNQLFVAITSSRFGDYDFDKEGFNLSPITILECLFTKNFRGENFYINLLNYRNFDFMKIAPDPANNLIKAGTGIRGPTREYRMAIYFKFDVPPKDAKENNLYAVVQRIDVIDDEYETIATVIKK